MDSLISFILTAHSIWRWVVLIVIILIVLKSLVGWFGKKKWRKLDTQLVQAARFIMYVQVVLGVLLLILLGFQGYWPSMGLFMRFLGEHIFMALLAVGGVEFGTARSKKVSKNKKFMFTFIGFGLSLLFIVATIGAATQWQLFKTTIF